MQNSDYWTVKAGNKALTCLETILNPHTPGYHTNCPAWKRQIAGFGWEWQSQILHLALPWCSQGHRRQNTNPGPPWLTHTLPTLPCGNPSIQHTKKKQEGRPCISFFVCLRKGWASITQSGGKRLSAVPPRAILPQLLAEKREGGGKRENPSLIIIHGTDCPFWIFSFPTRHSIPAALTSANQRVGIRVSALSKLLRIWQTMASEPSMTVGERQ